MKSNPKNSRLPNRILFYFVASALFVFVQATVARVYAQEIDWPKSYSESTDPRTGDKTINFYMEDANECTGNACNSTGAPEGKPDGADAGGGANIPTPGIEPQGNGVSQAFGKGLVGSLNSAVNNALSRAFGRPDRSGEMANALVEARDTEEFLAHRRASVESSIKAQLQEHWRKGHFYSEQQLETERRQFDELSKSIDDGSFSNANLIQVVRHAPATHEQVDHALQEQLSNVIAAYKRMADICGPDGMCSPEFYFDQKSYISSYRSIVEQSEEPNFEKYLQVVENGVDAVSNSLSAQYSAAASSQDNGGGKGLPPPRGGLLKALADLKLTLSSLNPASKSGQEARRAGLRSILQGEKALSNGDTALAEANFKIGKALADIAIGATPVINVARDVYEAITGLDLLTGEKLTIEARQMAAIGAMTIGLASEERRIAQALESASSDGRVLKKTLAEVESTTAEEANRMLATQYALKEPYRPGTRVYTFRASEEAHLARVYAEGVTNREGAWLLDPKHIEGLSGEEIATKFSLPSIPTHVSNVTIPKGTVIERGAVNKTIFDGDADVAYQFRLLDIRNVRFANGIPLPTPQL